MREAFHGRLHCGGWERRGWSVGMEDESKGGGIVGDVAALWVLWGLIRWNGISL